MVSSVFDLCTVLHQQTFEIPLVVLSKHQRKKKHSSDYSAVDFN